MTQNKSTLPQTLPATDHASKALWSRRRLLKEMGKAHGAMAGLLVLPTAWTKPLMEFAAVGAITMLSGASNNNSNTGGNSNTTMNPNTTPSSTPTPTPTPSPTPCMSGTLNLPFPAGTPVQVTFAVFWYGANTSAADINVTLDRTAQTLTFKQAGTIINLTSSSAKGTYNATTNTVSGPLTTFQSTVTLGFTTQSAARSWNNTPPESITLDVVVSTGANPSLSISNAKSSHCP